MPQQWEYCSVGAGGRGWVYRCPLGGPPQRIKRDKAIKGDNDWQAAFRLMDRLGAEGWEMVTVAGETGTFFFFKRPASAPPP
ncbi:MAG: hypothetical protein IT317_01775 [Anaerolineales bacterium]|nr:hypothetical protein [Anaerolineales bacterium]